jgi:hypothetical protein
MDNKMFSGEITKLNFFGITQSKFSGIEPENNIKFDISPKKDDEDGGYIFEILITYIYSNPALKIKYESKGSTVFHLGIKKDFFTEGEPTVNGIIFADLVIQAVCHMRIYLDSEVKRQGLSLLLPFYPSSYFFLDVTNLLESDIFLKKL